MSLCPTSLVCVSAFVHAQMDFERLLRDQLLVRIALLPDGLDQLDLF